MYKSSKNQHSLKLYSIDALRVMKRRQEKNIPLWTPYPHSEIVKELQSRGRFK